MSADPAPFVPSAAGGARIPPAPWRVFGNSSYFRLWTAQVISSLGDWIGLVAIISVAARVSGNNGAAIGLVMVARMLPGFFLATLGGVLVDRWDRRRVMVSCDVGRVMIFAYLPFLKTVAGLFFASFLIEVLTLLWSPAKDASVPNIVPPDKLATANSLSLVAAYGTFPVGSLVFASLAGLSGFLAHHFHVLHFLQVNREALPLWFDGMTFLTSATLIWSLSLGRPERADHGRVDWGRTWRDVAEGLRFIGSHEIVRGVMVGLGAGLFGGGAVIPLGPVFSKVVLGAGTAGFGLLMTGLGMGAAVGVLALSPVQRHLPREAVFGGAVVGAGGAIVLAATMSTLAPAVLLVGALGVCAGSAYVTGFTVIQENVSDELRGRTFATLYTVIRLCLLISLALGPVVSGALDALSRHVFANHHALRMHLPGVRLALWLAGGIVIVAGMLALIEVRRSERVSGSTAADPAGPATS